MGQCTSYQGIRVRFNTGQKKVHILNKTVYRAVRTPLSLPTPEKHMEFPEIFRSLSLHVYDGTLLLLEACQHQSQNVWHVTIAHNVSNTAHTIVAPYRSHDHDKLWGRIEIFLPLHLTT